MLEKIHALRWISNVILPPKESEPVTIFVELLMDSSMALYREAFGLYRISW